MKGTLLHEIDRMLPAFAIAAMAGCAPGLDHNAEPTTFRYTDPQMSGLVPVRPYPNPDDVCQIIRENAAIRDPAVDGSFLIACPKHEKGAIADRRMEGAKTLAHARHWSIFVVAQ